MEDLGPAFRHFVTRYGAQLTVQRQFIGLIVRHLMLNVPSFNAEQFAEELYHFQAVLPAPENDDDSARIGGFDEWREIIEMIEQQIKSLRDPKSAD